MLARFKVSNWRDFEPTELNLVATNERHFSSRLAKRGYTRLLPVCAIAGDMKDISSFLMSLRMLQLVVTRWDVFKQDFPLFNPNGGKVRFEVDIFIDRIPYYYVLECDKHGISKEILKHRSYLVFDRSKHRWADDIRLQQTLLQYMCVRGLTHATNVYNWFKCEMQMIAPDQRLDFFEHWHKSFAVRCTTDLMPVFHDLISNLYPMTYVVDGYELMLGNSTAYSMLNEYLKVCNKNTQTQLILTLTNTELFDKHLFRLDERWVMNNKVLRRI